MNYEEAVCQAAIALWVSRMKRLRQEGLRTVTMQIACDGLAPIHRQRQLGSLSTFPTDSDQRVIPINILEI